MHSRGWPIPILVLVFVFTAACSQNARPGVFGDAGTGAPSPDGPAVVTSTSEAGSDSKGDDEADTASSEESAGSGAAETAGAIYDVGGGPPGPGNDLPCDCPELEWSYIWIANSQEGTVSKINTRTLLEEGRYRTGPGLKNPSRTSVSIDGRAAVVANRDVGVVKIWAREEYCVDSNAEPGIQTSTGSADVLPWGEDECVAWYVDFPDKSVQRPVAWAAGPINPDTCAYEDQKVWTIAGGDAGLRGDAWCEGGGVTVYRLDGETGAIEDTLEIPPVDFPCLYKGPYGAATDPSGNLWFQALGAGRSARVDYETLEYEIFPDVTGYSLTVDAQGRAWFPQWRYDPDTETTTYLDGSVGPADGGLAIDDEGRVWASAFGDGGNGVVAFDEETGEVVDVVYLPTGEIKGVSVDIDGFVWAIPFGSRALKIDPDTHEFDEVEGLVGAYTYSDMTGGQLIHAVCSGPAG